MQNTKLPPRPSLEFLRKTAKERLAIMRRTNARAQLADALHATAQEHGFPSWRALKAEVDRRQSTNVDRFIAACRDGDVATIRALLAEEPSVLHARDDDHRATGIHFAAGGGHVDAVRALLDAGADPRGDDDITGLGVIGWATCFPPGGRISSEVVSLLLERGAPHHVFSALALGDVTLIRSLVEQNPETLDRRTSLRERGQTALHFAISRGRDDLLQLLIDLGADVEAVDANGQTPLEYALLRGDRAAADHLVAAGAMRPQPRGPAPGVAGRADIGASVRGLVPILLVKDVGETLRWYVAVGFKETGRYPAEGTTVYWGMVTLGAASLMFEPGTAEGASATLLVTTDRIHDQYDAFKARQLEAAQAGLVGARGAAGTIEFIDDLHEPPFGGLRFSVRDCNGYTLQFLQEGGR